MRLLLLVLLGVLISRDIYALVEPLQTLPYDLEDAFEMYHKIGDLSEQPGELVFWSSVQSYMRKFASSRHRPVMSDVEYDFLREKVTEFSEPLFGHYDQGSRVKRQAATRPQPRLRREIRTMSRRERELYFMAVNALKNDTRLSPNIYDVLSDFHSGENIGRAHFGPNFPSWHRLYLWLYESFLRLHVPSVTVPFWASVLDNEMADPTQSVIFSAAFFGNGVGEPTVGPFRHWGAVNPARVFTRNFGNGPLYTYEDVDAIVNQTRNRDILLPTALARSNFEMRHGGAHVFVGGSMNRLDEAVRDPIFYSHHAFVDQIWERFRFNQYSNGVNPGLDYPWIAGDPRFRPEHSPNATMGFFPNNELNIDYVNAVGYSNAFFNLVQYERVPTCPACGGSPYLRCDRTRGRCVSRSIAEMGGRNMAPIGPGGRTKRQTDTSYADTCPKPSYINDYDEKKLWSTPAAPITVGPAPTSYTDWVYIPVKIVTKRTDDYHSFKQYSLDGVTADPQQGFRSSLFQRPAQYSYPRCPGAQATAGKVKVVSYGLNYEGYAEEYAVTDNRLAVSVTTGYVPVKRPDADASEAIIAAFDSCGRVCKPYCRSLGSAAMAFPGGIRVTDAAPQQYGNSYGEATLNAWYVPSSTACPTLDYENIPISFFCEYTDKWVWSTSSSSSPLQQQQQPQLVQGMGMSPLNQQLPVVNPNAWVMDQGSSLIGGSQAMGGAGGMPRPHAGGRGRARGRARGRRPGSHRAGVPFNGSPQLFNMVPGALSNYSLAQQHRRNQQQQQQNPSVFHPFIKRMLINELA